MTSPHSAPRAGAATASRDPSSTRLTPSLTPVLADAAPVAGGDGVAGPAGAAPARETAGRDGSGRDGAARAGSPGRRLLQATEWTFAERALNLSGRELEIAQAIFDDRTESLIARDLGISPHTVHTHVERLYRKLAVASRTQLVLRITATAMGRDGV